MRISPSNKYFKTFPPPECPNGRSFDEDGRGEDEAADGDGQGEEHGERVLERARRLDAFALRGVVGGAHEGAVADEEGLDEGRVPRTIGSPRNQFRLESGSQGNFSVSMRPSERRQARAKPLRPRIMTPSMTACPP